VPGDLFRKLLGRSPTLSADVQEALGTLNELRQQRPALAGAATVLLEVLPALSDGTGYGTPPPLGPNEAATKLAGGVPLLVGEEVAFEVVRFRRLWCCVCQALEKQVQAEAAKQLAAAVRSGRLDPRELVRSVLARRPDAVHARAEELGLDPALTASVLRLTLFPLLSNVESAVRPLREGVAWRCGYCPTCGAWPLLGEFRGLEQTRFLRCGLCSAGWEFPRLMCPFCGNHDYESLGYLHAEGEEAKYRAATCDACRGYLKMTATLAALSGPMLLVTDLATTHLDLAAAERGYAPPP
jgi:FdhE protein